MIYLNKALDWCKTTYQESTVVETVKTKTTDIYSKAIKAYINAITTVADTLVNTQLNQNFTNLSQGRVCHSINLALATLFVGATLPLGTSGLALRVAAVGALNLAQKLTDNDDAKALTSATTLVGFAASCYGLLYPGSSSLIAKTVNIAVVAFAGLKSPELLDYLASVKRGS